MTQSSIWPPGDRSIKLNSSRAYWLKWVDITTNLAQIVVMNNSTKITPIEGDDYYEFDSLEIQIPVEPKLGKYIRNHFDTLWADGTAGGTKEVCNPISKSIRRVSPDEDLDT
jgi:hypothetical protein